MATSSQLQVLNFKFYDFVCIWKFDTLKNTNDGTLLLYHPFTPDFRHRLDNHANVYKFIWVLGANKCFMSSRILRRKTRTWRKRRATSNSLLFFTSLDRATSNSLLLFTSWYFNFDQMLIWLILIKMLMDFKNCFAPKGHGTPFSG